MFVGCDDLFILRSYLICIPSFAVIVFVERMVELRNELNKIGKRREKRKM